MSMSSDADGLGNNTVTSRAGKRINTKPHVSGLPASKPRQRARLPATSRSTWHCGKSSQLRPSPFSLELHAPRRERHLQTYAFTQRSETKRGRKAIPAVKQLAEKVYGCRWLQGCHQVTACAQAVPELLCWQFCRHATNQSKACRNSQLYRPVCETAQAFAVSAHSSPSAVERGPDRKRTAASLATPGAADRKRSA